MEKTVTPKMTVATRMVRAGPLALWEVLVYKVHMDKWLLLGGGHFFESVTPMEVWLFFFLIE